MRRSNVHIPGLLMSALMLFAAASSEATEQLPEELTGVTILDARGQDVALDQTFLNHEGEPTRLSEFFESDRPVILTLNYYECGTLCNLMLNRLVDSLKRLEVDGDEFRIVTVSIDPDEDAALAARTRESYLAAVGRDDLDWEFLVGDPNAIRAVAESVGFGYRYDPEQDQYAHLTALFFVSPDGVLTQTLYGLAFPPRDMKFALMEASQGQIGSPLERILLSCFHFVNGDGKYTIYAFGVMRVGGFLTIVFLGLFLAYFWRRERRLRRLEAV